MPKSEIQRDRDFPYWLVAVVFIGIALTITIIVNDLYREATRTIIRGLWLTVFVAIFAYLIAALIGILLALMRLSRSIWLRQIAQFYVEVMRGIPIIVLLFYVAFVLTPLFVAAYNFALGRFGIEEIRTRDIALFWRAVAALVLAYSSFLAEIFRAGFLAIDRGQIEAARALGLSPWQIFQRIILPQAVIIVFPPLSNDFLSLVKDSSLVSVIGVADIAQLAKVYAAGSFRYAESYNITAYLYLTLTIGFSLVLGRIEKRLRAGQGQIADASSDRR